MKDTQAIIERVRRINADVQHLELAVDDSLTKIKPGQSLLVRVAPFNPNFADEIWHPYLREQWYPVNMVNNKLLIERPTEIRYEPGQIVNAMGLIGQPIRFRKSARTVLLIAYNTPPTALLMTIPWLLGNKIAVTLVLLGSATDYGTQHLPPEIEVIRGSAGTQEETLVWPNQVLTAGWADQVLVVVSKDDELLRFGELMARLKELRNDVPPNYIFGVFQPWLPCGVGACAACLLRVGDELQAACSKGPSFDLTTVQLPK